MNNTPWYRHPGTLAAAAWGSTFVLTWLYVLDVPIDPNSWGALIFFFCIAIGASALASDGATGRAKERDD